MPNNPRQDTKRKLDMAANAIENAQKHIFTAAAQYRPGVHDHKPEGYPQYFEPMDILNEGLEAAIQMVKEIQKSI